MPRSGCPRILSALCGPRQNHGHGAMAATTPLARGLEPHTGRVDTTVSTGGFLVLLWRLDVVYTRPIRRGRVFHLEFELGAASGCAIEVEVYGSTVGVTGPERSRVMTHGRWCR